MHKRLDLLQPYPFQKLSALFDGVTAPAGITPIRLSIGEPKHDSPQFVLDELCDNLHGVANYPPTRGSDKLREAISGWLQRRYHLPENLVTPQSHILPVNGTREALFAFAQCIIDSSQPAAVLMPNPFYQIYEGATILAGANPVFLNTGPEDNFLPNLDAISESTWRSCQLFYACSPGNPTGTIYPKDLWLRLIEYADKYDFVIAADECYSEIYSVEEQPPAGLLQICHENGRDNLSRCVIFHSLSKRSNLPGLRSGFVAGDAEILKQFLLYRTYHGCAMPPPTQAASVVAWDDETHVIENRKLYREKFAAVTPILSPWLQFHEPPASFYLWASVPGGDDEAFARALYKQQHVTVLPGSYLSRDTKGGNPGKGYVRMALVANVDECIEAAQRIARHCEGLS